MIEIEHFKKDLLLLNEAPIHMQDIEVKLISLLLKYNKNKLSFTDDAKTELKDAHKSWYIETLLLGIPMLPIVLFEHKSGIFEIIDGNKRVGTLLDFFSDRFALQGLTILDSLNKLSFQKLSPKEREKLQSYKLHVRIFEPPTPSYMAKILKQRVNIR